MSLAGARLARQACDEVATPERPRFVAGSIGPLNVSLSVSPRVDDPSYRAVTFDQVAETYAEQIRGLVEGGADLLLVETIFDTLNAKAAIAAALDAAPDVPLWLSFTAIDRSGRNLSGQTVEAFWVVGRAREPARRGRQLRARRHRDAAVPRRPRASRLDVRRLLPERGPAERDGRATTRRRDVTSGLLREFAEEGLVNIVGGCCGTTPEHVERIAARCDGLPPRAVPRPVEPPALQRARARVHRPGRRPSSSSASGRTSPARPRSAG